MFTGIIPIAKDEDGLAAILGHGLSFRVGLTSFSANLAHRDSPCGGTAQCGEIFVYESFPCICNTVGSLRT